MAIFDRMLRENETIFKNEAALDYAFLPKVIPFREKEQKGVAECIKPLLMGRMGRNVLVHGPPGVGKTAAVKHLLKELEENDEYPDAVSLVFINCWQKNTTFKVLLELADQLEYPFVQNKSSEELWQVLKQMLNKKPAVLVFDEIDKIEGPEFLYTLIEDVKRKTIIMITNYKAWLLQIDERIKSRLLPEMLEFASYTEGEAEQILMQRCAYAFNSVPEHEIIRKASEKSFLLQDVRIGLFLLKEAGLLAEERSSRRIEERDMENAIGKIDLFSAKNAETLDPEMKLALDLVRSNPGQKIGDLFKAYGKSNGKGSYKTFQRMISKLDEDKFISLQKVTGKEGNTTIVNKKLSEF